MDIRHTSRYLGIFLLISGFLNILPVIVAIYYNEEFIHILITVLLSCTCGFMLSRYKHTTLDFGDVMLLSALTVLILPFFGAIPFFMTLDGTPMDVLVNGYFESMSAITTTGLTILPDELLSPDSPSYHSTIFRRTLSEWIGGLGVVIIFLSILARGGISTVYISHMEGGIKRITPSIGHTAKIIVRVYLFFTIIGTIVLWLSGVDDMFHAITAVMSTISSGGFIFFDKGFNPDWLVMGILSVFMLIGAISFTLHYTLFSGNLIKFFRNTEIKTLCMILPLFTISLTIIFWQNGAGIFDAFYMSITNVISTLTTTGHEDMNLENAGNLGKFFLVIMAIIGGGAGSTAGGLKIIRITVLITAVRWLIKKSSLPETAILPLKVNKRVFSDKEMRTIGLFFFIYIFLLAFGMLVIMVFGTDVGNKPIEPMDALLLSASAQGTGSVTTLNIAAQPVIVKIMLIFQMIAGRLEIFPIMALIGYAIKDIRHEVKVAESEAIKVEHEVVDTLWHDVKIVEGKINRIVEGLKRRDMNKRQR